MSQDTPETILIPRSEFLNAIVQASRDGAAAERVSIQQRLIELREAAPAGSTVSILITKWIHELD